MPAILSAILALLLLVPSLGAQTVRGRVTAPDRSPVAGAYVIHLSSEHHAHTNELGNFQLDGIKIGDTLQVSCLGYQQATVVVPSNKEEILVELKEAFFDLAAITVRPTVSALNVVTDIDVRVQPVNSAQDILRRVPGLIIGQHAGGGKAEQLFLRGFDIDHGTDIAIRVEGMPVNMVSHAHGQGYADLHFLIPETIEKIDYGKGPYYADHGNFATAGYVDFSLKDKLDRSLLTAEIGAFNTLRTVGLLDLLSGERSDAYLASEFTMTDGPFEASQHFSRLNLLGRYSTEFEDGSRLSLLASHFTSKWDASGQIPLRAVKTGLIGRFGAIDETEGGYTSRTNVAAELVRVVNRRTFVKSNVYFSRYDFELFSNFTFFLEDPVNGDQISQSEARQLYGFQSELNSTFNFFGGESQLRAGLGLRYDDVDDIGLNHTKNRRDVLRQIQLGDVDETNLFAYAGADFTFGRWLIHPGLRLDQLVFNYVDRLSPTYDRQERRKAAVSPKLNVSYTANNQWQLYLKSGMGFHANDARVVIDRTADKILPMAFGADAGGIYRPAARVFLNAALWYLFLEQEFVYVGDAGIVEPSGQTRRIGVDFGVRYQLTDWLFADADVNYAFARSVVAPEGANYIPLAPNLTATGGLQVLSDQLTGGIRYRYVGDRPANELNSIVADGYFLIDANVNYSLGSVTLGLVAENVLNAEWNEAQFATESRLSSETMPVEELHFTPGVPLNVRGVMRYSF